MRFQLSIFFFIFSFTGLLNATVISMKSVCQENTCYNFSNGMDLYKSKLPLDLNIPAEYISDEFNMEETCIHLNDCYIFLGFVGDTFSIELNGNSITNLIRDNNNYLTYTSSIVPLPAKFFSESKNILKVFVRDLNKYQWGLLNSKIEILSYRQVKALSVKDWLVRTGFTIFSAYFLLIFSILTFITFFVFKTKNALNISLYCIIAFCYLISFSEIPREYFDPEVFSGIIHFPLRLAQDAALCYVFHAIFNRNKDFKFLYRSLVFLYTIAIGAFCICALLGIYDFPTVKNIILIGAPLVAMPMGYGFILVLRQSKSIERSLLLPFFLVLLLFQLNDLLIFWQLINSFYTVKFYIPFIVILLVFIEIRRYSLDYSTKTLMAEKVQNAKQIAHDIRSPLSALNIVSEKIVINSVDKEILIGAVQAIDQIATSLMQQTSLKIGKNNASQVLAQVITQKKIEFSNLQIDFTENIHESKLCVGDGIELARILSNIINNSTEASANSPNVKIELKDSKKWLIIKVSDNGKGMPKHVLKNIGTFGFSFGKNTSEGRSGHGLGLYNAIKTLERWGGEFRIDSAVGQGTAVEIKIPWAEA